MKRYLKRIGAVLKLSMICLVIIFILLILFITPLKEAGSQGFDMKSAGLISLGFAVSFRAMLCCRKKV